MVGGSQVLLEGLRSMMQDGLTGGKEVMLTLAFLPYSLFFQFLHKFYMFPMECSRSRGPHSGILTKGLGIGNFHFLELFAPNHFGLSDSHPIAILSFQDCLGTIHPGVEDFLQTENFGSLVSHSLIGFILA